MTTRVETPDAWRVASDVIALTKPRITLMLVATIAAGALVAPGPLDALAVAIALFATSLVMGSANALNMYLERDVDAEMERTCMRPLPTGRLAPSVALWFGLTLGAWGILFLAFGVGPLTASLAALALFSYVLAYTPLKRTTPLALWVGAVPGALPPLIGWTATTGSLSLAALSVFGILFFWQIPHFCAIALFRQADYERAGLKVLPAVRGVRATKRVIVVSSVVMVLATLAPVPLGVAGVGYAAVATLVGAAFVALALRGLREDAGNAWAKKLFFASMPYLVVVYGALVIAAF